MMPYSTDKRHILQREFDPSDHQEDHLCLQEELQDPLPRQQVSPTLVLPRVSFVIPTLNEEKNLPYLMPRLSEWAYEVIIVDGRSTDRTVEIARQLRPDVIIVMEPKPGKGAALRAGFNAARGDVIVMLDADNSMEPGEAIVFVSALMAGADLVKGSRSIQGAGSADLSRFRAFGNWCLTKIVRWLFWCCFTDLCYGYAAFWSKHAHIFECDCDGFEIETLINVRAVKHKLKIVEIASYESFRLHGASNLRAIPDGTRILRTILRERFRTPRHRHNVRPFPLNQEL
jgi:glycosyltransferase involved in cell wall biosynthesis